MSKNYKEKEIWKDVKYNEYTETRYQVSNYGRIKNKRTGHIFTPTLRKRGDYPAVGLQIGAGEQKILSVHRIVAIEFLPNPENLPEVNHKDQNKENPRLQADHHDLPDFSVKP